MLGATLTSVATGAAAASSDARARRRHLTRLASSFAYLRSVWLPAVLLPSLAAWSVTPAALSARASLRMRRKDEAGALRDLEAMLKAMPAGPEREALLKQAAGLRGAA